MGWSTKTLVGNNWVAASDLDEPHGVLIKRLESTQKKIQLIDGSQVRLIPSTYYNHGTVSFEWYNEEGVALLNRLVGYFKNYSGVQMTTHVPDYFEGVVTNVEISYLPGTSPQQFNIKIDFDNFDIDGDGYIGPSGTGEKV